MALLTSVSWSFAVPVFESPDEPHHWQYARYLHDERRLPLYGPNFVEANSPPLYYLAIAPLARYTALPSHLVWQGADGGLVLPYAPRFYLNAGDDFTRYWPIRAARLLTAFLTALAALIIFRAGAETGGATAVGLLSAAFVAFLPQFAFRAGTISNDSILVTSSAGLTLCVLRGVRGRVANCHGVWTGLWLAAAYLTKINAICLALGIVMAALVGNAPIRRRAIWACVALGVALLVVLPWSLRNIVLYGDPFASGAMNTAVASLIVHHPLTSSYFYTVFPFALSRSFIGVFGWMNVWMSETMYRLFGLVMLIGIIGVVITFFRNRQDRQSILVLLTLILGALAVVIHINRTFHQPQGRYLFPALPALGLLWALGIGRLLNRVSRPTMIAWCAATCLAMFNGYALTKYIIHSYYPPVLPVLRPSAERLTQVAYSFGLRSSPEGWLTFTNLDPQIGFTTAIAAEDFGFLEFEIEGQHNSSIVPGSIFFALDSGASGPDYRVGFAWKADGIRRKIIVPLRTNPLWRGRVKTIRIDPLEPVSMRDLNGRVRISDVTIRNAPEW